MPSEEYKKAFLFLSNKCSKKELSAKEALIICSKFRLKIVEKNKLINELKKNQFIDHLRFANAFVHDRFNLYFWGKNKIRHHLLLKGIEDSHITAAIECIDNEKYKNIAKQEALKKHKSLGSKQDFNSKQKILKYLNLKGFESDLSFEVIDLIID
jgi:regulatory protein